MEKKKKWDCKHETEKARGVVTALLHQTKQHVCGENQAHYRQCLITL